MAWNRRRVLFPIAIVAMCPVVAFLVAIGMSKAYWGYWFSRPEPDRLLASMRFVASVTPITNGPYPDLVQGMRDGTLPATAYRVLRVEGDSDPAGAIQLGEENPEYPYYFLAERVLRHLRDTGRLQGTLATLSEPTLHEIYPLLERSEALARPSAGYLNTSRYLTGYAIEGADAAGNPLLVLALSGGETSNDHRPYYELLFTKNGPTQEWRLSKSQRFYFDVAGIEGAEWPSFFFYWLPPACILIPIVSLMGAVLVRQFRSRSSGVPLVGA